MRFTHYLYDFYLLAAGLFGSLVLVSNRTQKSKRAIVAAIFTGTSVSFFFTPVMLTLPVVKDMSVATTHRIDFAIGFLLGTFGWGAVLYFQNLIFRNKK